MAMVFSAIIGSLVLALSGCSDQSGQTEKTLRVGVITYSQDDPFINALTDELKAHLKTMERTEDHRINKKRKRRSAGTERKGRGNDRCGLRRALRQSCRPDSTVPDHPDGKKRKYSGDLL